ncbi:MAG: hypothetical protein IPM51_11360 [Sphingobacteriaceae bacterium]|nr:hypothetical protein [Sphingobacteriaceae bacterium]
MNKILILLLSLYLGACKKNHVCQCTNSNNTYVAGIIENSTKASAKKSCKDLNTDNTTCSITDSYK